MGVSGYPAVSFVVPSGFFGWIEEDVDGVSTAGPVHGDWDGIES